MRPGIIAVLLSTVAIAALGQTEPPQLQHANVITRSSADLTAEIRRIASENRASWIAYAVPSVAPGHQMCCFSFSEGVTSSCGCDLERPDHGQSTGYMEGISNVHLEPRPYFY